MRIFAPQKRQERISNLVPPMLRVLFSFIPFMVCLCWCITFALQYRRNDPAKRLLTLFLAVCVVLYFCHALFFNVGLSHPMECLWTLCSLSVYPIYYAYLCRLTARTIRPLFWCWLLLPGALVALLKLTFPGDLTELLRKCFFMVQVFCVLYFGYRRLQAYDRQLAEVYADTEGRDTTAVKHLLVAFVITSFCSVIANGIGKQYFAQSDWLLLLVLTPFSVMLYALSYIGFTREFEPEQLVTDSTEAEDIVAQEEQAALPDQEIGLMLTQLMEGERFFLTPNLKIGDVVRRLSICRTYLSAYINQTYNASFSDYVNRLRIEYAQQLLRESPSQKLLVIAQQSGFATEQSFYRNFHKFTGQKPSEWLREANLIAAENPAEKVEDNSPS